ncbi:uncharacterized protein BDCG_05463 [Blastomyces dermatitidis ER-3]|uniref:Uncharacterized protein n=1 Tax=Ajellomyces dermatitidis (strain ER-3 / ATCC MYA-2586) TaxID=559297 RepID=A0ABP2F111_AJEDR|nr:uncharacterized protein BDCG_05463 [Blastomyces dermatitidis ER-3]EEQ90343.1 hypothetical protein BDCG_05463 [Blastomyces dermatitidis ER-3]
MSRSTFATFTSFESQRSSPPNVGAQSNQQAQEQQQTPTVYSNNNSNTSASFPSPTLTNPDMILPYDIERESSTPSPPFRPLQLPSPDHSGYRHASLQENGMHVSSAGIGVALSAANGAPNNYQQRNPPPRNNWVFAGHEVRPPLSDIGEEDSPTRSRWDEDDENMDVNNMSLGSPPVLEPRWRNDDDNKVRGNAVDGYADGYDDDCSASSSTISAPSEILDKWEEFRTDNGNGNTPSGTHPENVTHEPNQRCNQESDSFSQDIAGVESVRAIREEGEIDGGLDEEIDDEIPSAMLSKEAERILENAKKRLTHMEGNLSRARSSFRMSPSPSLLMGTLPLHHRQSTGNMGRAHSITERRAQTSLAGALMRQRISQDLNASSSHSRGLSDVSAQSAQNNLAYRDNMRLPFRSFSALGSTNASGFGASDISHSHDRFEPRATYKSPVSTFNYIPENPSECIGNKVSQSDSPHSKPDLLSAQEDNSSENNPPGSVNGVPKISSVEEFNATYPASIPSRSQSQLQVRGLQDQMQDLKSKISTLKVQAQEDNLRRRSLQSLRTPSPFTAAEQWYTSAGEYVGARGKGADAFRNEQNNERNVGGTVDQPHQTLVTADPPPAPEVVEEQKQQATSDRDRPDDQKSVVASLYEDADEEFDHGDSDDIDRAALAEILNEPLDSPVSSDEGIYEDFPPMPTVTETTRHEDREDAFDYEHFFLHSALGNYSREKAYQRRQSYSSTGSVETTRPGSQATVYLDTSPRGRQGHARNNSADTISTIASFETATEGADYDDYDVDSGDEIEKALYGTMNGNGTKYSHSDLRFRQHYQDPQPASRHQTRQTIISTNISVSPTPLSTASTPRASGKKASYNNTKGNNYRRSHSRKHSNDASTSLHEAVAHLRSPTVMISSLISSAATQLYKSESQDKPLIVDAQLSADDTKLMEGLLQSLGKVALQLQLSTNNGDKRSSADERSSILFRRRLDAARRVLEGQLDV